MARSTAQFFKHCRFDPEQPTAEPDTYRKLIRQVVSIGPRKELPEEKKIVIPGYADLREFSRAREPLLKSACGTAWQSYFQHGHWRMIWPFSRRHQERVAQQLVAKLNRDQPAVVHLVRFPQLTINHAVLLFDAAETEKEIGFAAYDPNAPERPTTLTYHRASRTFSLPASSYFAGGRVDVYEIYRSWRY